MRPVVLLLANDAKLAERVSGALEGFQIEAAVDPSDVPTAAPAALLIAASQLDVPWFRSVAEQIGRRSWWSHTVLVTSVSEDNARRLARLPRVRLVGLPRLGEGRLQRTVMEVVRRSREDGAISRVIELFRIEDDVLVDAVENLFRTSPPCRSVAALARELYCAPETVRARCRRAGLPGPPKELIDRALVTRVAWAVEEGVSLPTAVKRLGIPRSTGYRLVERVLTARPGSVSESAAWTAIEKWAGGRAGE